MGGSTKSDEKKGYEQLQAWQKAMDLAEEIYRLLPQLPTEERYELGSQIRRSAISIPSNIAEGRESKIHGVFLHQVRRARGSVAELETQLRLVDRLELTNSAVSSELYDLLADVARLTSGLERYLADKQP